MSIESSHGINAAIEHGHTNVAAPVVHGSSLMPGAVDKVKLVHPAKMLKCVETAKAVYVAIQDDGAMIGTRILKTGSQAAPTIKVDVIQLNGVGWMSSIPPTDGH